MSGCQSLPIVKRKTVTLDEKRVLQAVEGEPGLRIIRSNRRPVASEPETAAPPLPQLSNRTPNRPVDSHEIRVPAHLLRSATVLVINASQDMAREITLELSGCLPGCTILFAPTLSLALWILKRRSIDLILSSAVLPDGPLSKLHELLELLDPPPELVVLSELDASRSHMGTHPGYRFVELRRLTQQMTTPEVNISKSICELGADLRNDLNNPLQEIVAMAFVAQASQGLSPVAEQALSAIERAAGTMATVVGKLEDKIRGVVENAA